MHRIGLLLIWLATGCLMPVGEAESVVAEPELRPAADLDLLLVIDDSCSMMEEHASLAWGLGPFLDRLRQRFDTIQVGVVTSDMGTAGYPTPTCANVQHGRDAVLMTEGMRGVPACAESYPPFQTLGPGTDLERFATDVGCVVSASNAGCGFEQQLEAMMKAVSPSDSGPVFHGDRYGHGGGINAGFLRPDSMLAVLVLTDEEDCSAADGELFDPTSARFGATDLNLRCFAHADALHPVRRYVDGLLALRTHPSRVAYFALAGVPRSLEGGPPSLVLGSPLMDERLDPAMPSRLIASCNVPGRGVAFAPRRLVEVARRLDIAGARAGVGTLCTEDFAGPLGRFADLLVE